MVERCDLFGDDDRIMLRQDQNAGGQLDARRRRRNVCHPDQGIGQQEIAIATRQPSIGCIRIRRLIAAWDHRVLDCPG
jgi:hypothetical protein